MRTRDCVVWALACGLAGALAAAGEEPPAASPTPLQKLQQRADALAKEAIEHKPVEQSGRLFYGKGQILAARARLQMLYLLYTSPVGARLQARFATGELLAAADGANRELSQQRAKDLPALEKQLDLIIRNRRLDDAVADISKASGIKITLVPGSADDACQLAGAAECRVTWLDLRHATVVQALDWLAGLTKLDWRASKDGVTVGSQRLLPGESAWVYEVSRLVHPAESLKPDDTAAARNDAIRNASVVFLKAVTKALALENENVHWRGPGQLLIWGDAAAHLAAGKLFTALADAKATLSVEQFGKLFYGGGLAELHTLTVERYAKNKAGAEQHLAAQAQRRVAEALQTFSWKLLAAAADARLDLEALTELQAAWQAPQAAQLFKGPAALLAWRSAFAITEAAKALPKEDELAALSAQVLPLARAEADDALAAFERAPAGTTACLSCIYAALILDDPRISARVRLFSLNEACTTANPLAAPITNALLTAQPAGSALEPLLKNASARIAGADWVVLAALAFRRAGGEEWEAWRAAAKDILGPQALPGSVVVLVNHLGRASLPLVAVERK
ncbi:MAG: hypothetical protein NTW87_24845 [Planctomycetota bacterium]|nr:hypothetical protein [Planctomycetota bacterium]